MKNVSPSACGLVPWFIVKSNAAVMSVDEDIGVFMNALDASPFWPFVRLRSLAVGAVALPFNCNVVKSMLPALAAVAPMTTPSDKAALAKHDFNEISMAGTPL